MRPQIKIAIAAAALLAAAIILLYNFAPSRHIGAGEKAVLTCPKCSTVSSSTWDKVVTGGFQLDNGGGWQYRCPKCQEWARATRP